MHHYPFHPGDYMLDTAHLEPLHDLCYRRALDLYYTSEGPLADDKRTLSKRLRVAEQTLSEVLAEFFVLTENGWRHSRCDAEIHKWNQRGWFPHEGPRLRPPIDEWKVTRLRIFHRDNYLCRYCGQRGGKLECDHIIPVSRGGSNEDENLTTACRACNRKKSNKILPL